REKIVSFDPEDYVDDVKETVSKVRHRDFPILDEDYHYIGMFSRRNLLNPEKKRVILVDHNEKSQAVDGIDDAAILEIIDHHKLGSLETIQPIYFRNQPVGCCSTIVAMMYEEKKAPMEPHIAGLLLSAILSDTLMFRSPTCTQVDIKIAKKLAKIAGVDYEELAMSMFEAGSNFNGRTIEQIFYQDFKSFNLEDITFGVSQVSAVSEKQLAAISDDLQTYLEKVLTERNLDMVFVMLTDILDQKTRLLFAGHDAETVARRAFHQEAKKTEKIIVPGLVSRKKQLIPAVIETLQAMAE
ncbi:MAG: putative manganese-dependent inorganic diphosphatase, partial [Lachnospiraceae bacterium]|nr:putative manganese-dependent inorganic diphosphatase [Lachnospiraceae bacterium]